MHYEPISTETVKKAKEYLRENHPKYKSDLPQMTGWTIVTLARDLRRQNKEGYSKKEEE